MCVCMYVCMRVCRLTALKDSYDISVNKLANQEAGGINKFSTIALEVGEHLGSISDFHRGLEQRLGHASSDLWSGMEEEHLRMSNSDTPFTSPNYQITTTSKQEWEVLVTGKLPFGYPLVKGRVLRKLSDALKLKCTRAGPDGLHELSQAEVASVILYTGPMYLLYNSALRQSPGDTVYRALDGNTYTNTILALTSAVLKLQRKAALPDNLVVYRGLGCIQAQILKRPLYSAIT